MAYIFLDPNTLGYISLSSLSFIILWIIFDIYGTCCVYTFGTSLNNCFVSENIFFDNVFLLNKSPDLSFLPAYSIKYSISYILS